MPTRQSVVFTQYWLSLPSMLISIVPPFEPEASDASQMKAILERWRVNNWPLVHFFPESSTAILDSVQQSKYQKLLYPGACCIGADLLSPWSSFRFTDLHHDLGSPPVVVIGGELDRSVLATAVGAAERDVPVTVISSSAAFGRVHGNTISASRETVRSIIRGFALECSAAQILSATAETS